MIKAATRTAISCLLVFAYVGAASAEEQKFVPDYLDALESTTHGESTDTDIDAVLAFYADNIIYEHPKFGIRLEGKQAQRQGMTAFLSSYAGSREDSNIEILDFMKGDGVVTVSIDVSFLQKTDDGVTRISRRQMRVLEFTSGKISRVIDYW